MTKFPASSSLRCSSDRIGEDLDSVPSGLPGLVHDSTVLIAEDLEVFLG